MWKNTRASWMKRCSAGTDGDGCGCGDVVGSCVRAGGGCSAAPCGISSRDAGLTMVLLAAVVEMVLGLQKWYPQPRWWGRDDETGAGCTVLLMLGIWDMGLASTDGGAGGCWGG